jgi:hypothetical protein
MLDTIENIKKVDLHYVDPKDHSEVTYLHSKFPWISEKVIISAIEKQGPERKHIEDYLTRYHAEVSLAK